MHSLIIAGVDEAGRGCLAGPVVAGVVILSDNFSHNLFQDSKVLPEKKREEAFAIISEELVFAYGEASAEEIDEWGIKKATNVAMRRAVEGLSQVPDLLRVDGRDHFSFEISSEEYVRGDSLFPEISAASIVAKVIRDRKMKAYAEEFPEYGFEKHKGYGSELHREVLGKLGPTPIHRKSFDPLRTWLTQGSLF